MFKIERRYQYISRDGVKWTKWFVVNSFDTKEECDTAFKEYKKRPEPSKKLLGEYRKAET